MSTDHIHIPYERLDRSCLSAQELALENAALEAARTAYAPYSRFLVGASVLLDNGEVVTASNQENAAYPSGICAERAALFYAGARYPEAAPVILVLVALNEAGRVEHISPCGACRQVLMESYTRHGKPYRILLAGRDEIIALSDPTKLLPLAFDGSDLVL